VFPAAAWGPYPQARLGLTPSKQRSISIQQSAYDVGAGGGPETLAFVAHVRRLHLNNGDIVREQHPHCVIVRLIWSAPAFWRLVVVTIGSRGPLNRERNPRDDLASDMAMVIATPVSLVDPVCQRECRPVSRHSEKKVLVVVDLSREARRRVKVGLWVLVHGCVSCSVVSAKYICVVCGSAANKFNLKTFKTPKLDTADSRG
jgi:hypothetical protein